METPSTLILSEEKSTLTFFLDDFISRRAAPDHPVFLTRVDGHAGWVNERAMRLAGIESKTPHPAGGRIIRDKKGSPTGVLVDAAMALVKKKIPPPSQVEIRKALLSALHEASEHYFESGPKIGLSGNFLTIRSVKLFMDGALGSRGAALIDEYADDPGNRGLPQMSEDHLVRFCERAIRAGFQVATHAIGDRANQSVLNAYEKAFQAFPTFKDLRFRVEHAQVLHPFKTRGKPFPCSMAQTAFLSSAKTGVG